MRIDLLKIVDITFRKMSVLARKRTFVSRLSILMNIFFKTSDFINDNNKLTKKQNSSWYNGVQLFKLLSILC